MKRLIPFMLPLTLPFIGWFGIAQGGPWVLSTFIFIFVIHPIMDIFYGTNEEVLGPSTSSTISSSLLWISLPLQIFFLILVLNWVSTQPLSNLELFGIILTTGTVTCVMGVTISHELIHRRKRWERGIGVGLLLTVNYAHFRVEHVWGHHKHVGTPKDHASARLGDSIYTFLCRSIVMSWFSAWEIESKRKGLLKNRLVHYMIAQALISTLVFLVFSGIGLIVFFAQSGVAILVIEAINYVEHYGLERKEISPGIYEPVTELHSWDSANGMTNWLLFNLGRHAHHHAMPAVPYQDLRPSTNARKLKYGYSAEILLAFIGLNSK